MARHFQREIEGLKRRLFHLGALVEECLRLAVQSVETKDASLAQKVLEKDREVDGAEIEVEEECLKILALHQPVAFDLRFLITALKVNNDLERMGDLAVNIAERTIFELSQNNSDLPSFDFHPLAKKVQAMVRRSLDSLVEPNAEVARRVCADDQEVDELHRQMYEEVSEYIQKNPPVFNHFLSLLSVSRQLERIADHATNIAEDVIYLIEGNIVRHGSSRVEGKKKKDKKLSSDSTES